MTEETLFHEARAKANSEDRAAFLDAACVGQPQLRTAVEALLAASDRTGTFLNQPAVARPTATGDQALVAEGPGTLIGPYKLLQQIGEGGFGTVYMAEQEKPVRRMVALKLIKAGMDTGQVIARFESERQALAIMDHPNIARVLDAGATVSGRPYFVMDLVKGVPITDFCDKNHFAPEARLKLFVDVCHAIQHAHHKGVIHRDVKPSNVMVTLHDGVPVVKVIDFGVAKATAQKLTERTLFTAYGQMIGTPAYMSPEQAEMSGLDIDTRSDVFALGVLLYELMTGTTPLQSNRLREAGFAEMQRLIREEEPPRPSARLSSLGNSATVVAGNRGLDVKRLVQFLVGDLDWIVLKALEKDRNLRYVTPGNFAEDIDRYLRREAILARPPSTVYKLKKFVQRNRPAVVAASLVAASLLIGLSAAIWQTLRATRAEHNAVAERDAKEKARQSEETQRKEAEIQRDRANSAEHEAREQAAVARAVNEFLRIDLLGQAGSKAQIVRNFEPNPNLTVREALDRAAAVVGEKFKGMPDVEAGIRRTLGDAYLELGQYQNAIDQLQQSERIRRPTLGRDNSDTIGTQHSLGLAFLGAGNVIDAINVFEMVRDAQTARLGPDHPHTMTTLDSLAVAYFYSGKKSDALALFEHVRDVRTNTLGPEHPDTLITLHNLSTLQLDAGKTTDAIDQLERLRAAKVKVLGPEHPDVLPTMHNLATAYWKAKQLDRSIPIFQQSLKLHQQLYGESHPSTLGAMANLGVNYRDAGRMEDAISLLEHVHRAGREDVSLNWVAQELLIALERAEKVEQAAAFTKELIAAAQKTLPADSPQLANTLLRNGATLLRLKAWSDAETVLREYLAIRETKEPDEWTTFRVKSMLGTALLAQKKYPDAERILLQFYDGVTRREAKLLPNTKREKLRNVEELLVQLYDAWGKPDEAAKWRTELERAKNAAEE